MVNVDNVMHLLTPALFTRYIEVKGVASFAAEISAIVTALWAGEVNNFVFLLVLRDILTKNYTDAWHEGAKECDILPDELTDEENDALQSFINSQMYYAFGLAGDINVNSRINGGELAPLLVRAQLWINRYGQARNQAMVLACGNKKLKWVLGVAEHCQSCLKLANKVKRAREWLKKGVIPQVAGATYLECGGYRCQCNLVVTSDRVTPGPLPSLP